MICLICRRAEVTDRETAVQFERGEMRLTVRDVPALVCPACGDVYVRDVVAERLLQMAQAAIQAGERETWIDFNASI